MNYEVVPAHSRQSFHKRLLIVRNYKHTMWQDWVTGVLGVWVLLIPFVGADSTTVLVVTGVVIAALGFWSAMGGKKG